MTQLLPVTPSPASASALHWVLPTSRVFLQHPAPSASGSTTATATAKTAQLMQGHVIFNAEKPLDPASASTTSAAAAGGGGAMRCDGITEKLFELTTLIDTFFSLQLPPTTAAAGGGGEPQQQQMVANAAQALPLARTRALLMSGVSGVGKSYMCQRLQSYYQSAAARRSASAAPGVTVLYVSALEVLTSLMAGLFCLIILHVCTLF